MNRILFIALALAAIAACGGRLEKVENVNEYGETERYRRDPETYAREGAYERYSAAGELLEKAEYKNDTLTGERILYFETGQPNIVERYDNGRFDGPYRIYNEAGDLIQEGQYVQNQMEGEWKTYFPGGQLKESVTFQNNTENGPFREWYENGNLQAEGTYNAAGKETGELRVYDEDGSLNRIMDCENGVCRTRWSKESGTPAPES